jgi:small subunit ribosomal protein S17
MADTAKPKTGAAKPKAPAKTKASAPKATAPSAKAVAVVAKPAVKAVAKPSPKARAERPKRAAGAVPGIERAERKTREGLVVSTKMQNTVVVEIERRVQHPIYGKVVLRTKRFKAHDVIGCDEGDRVEIMETRPISKQKRWRVTQILGKVK